MLWWKLRQLKSDDWRAAQRAALELGTAKEQQAADPLLAALGSPHERVRFAAAWALAELGDPRVVEPVIALFRAKPAEPYARVLGKFKDPRSIEPLVAALIHEDPALRQLAGVTLETIDPEWPQSRAAKAAILRFRAALHDPHPDIKRLALELLEKIGDQEVARELLRVTERDIASVGWAVRELDRINPEWTRLPQAASAVPALIELLRGEGFERELAAATLAAIGDPRAVDPLVDALRDRDRDLRNAAARALGQLGDPRAISSLVVAPLDGLLDPWVAQHALVAIDPKWGTTPEARTVMSSCFRKLATRDVLLREYAESTLAAIDPTWPQSEVARDAIPMIEQQLHHPDPDVREAAAKVLALIRR